LLSARCLLLLPLTAALVAGCGASSKSTKLTADTTAATSTSSSARTLLSQTFDTQHKLTSGNLSFGISIVPSGSSVITDPITLSVSGPFQASGQGQLPSMDLTISGSAQGHDGTLQLVLAGGNAYIILDGQSYAVPATILAKLKAQLALDDSAKGKQTGMKLLSHLGIDSSDWLSDPTVVGTADVDGVATTHVHATVDVGAILQDANKLLTVFTKTSSSAGAGSLKVISHGISSADQAEIEKELGAPSFDAWTGNSDKILRRLRISATLPVSGATSSQLGGLTSAAVTFSYDMSDVNQPQTITAPTSVEPFSQLLTKVHSLTASLGAELWGSGLIQESNSGGLLKKSSGSNSGSFFGSTVSSSSNKRYIACVENAGSDTAKIQKCTALLAG